MNSALFQKSLVEIDEAESEALEAAKTRWALEEDRIRTDYEARRQLMRDGYPEFHDTQEQDRG